GDFSCVRRTHSNTPLQALTTLNETVFMDCARALAVRVLKEGGQTDEDRIDFAFRVCISRPPTSEEKAELFALLQKQRKRIAEGTLDPAEVPRGKKGGARAARQKHRLPVYTIFSGGLWTLDDTTRKE